MAVVLDASAVLAWVRDEPGGDRVMSAVQHGALVSAVNWAEVLTRLVQSSGGRFAVSTHAVPFRDEGPLTLVAFDDQQARETARLWRHTHSLGLSLGDRAALALARLRGLPVLTADRAWRSLRSLAIQIELIR